MSSCCWAATQQPLTAALTAQTTTTRLTLTPCITCQQKLIFLTVTTCETSVGAAAAPAASPASQPAPHAPKHSLESLLHRGCRPIPAWLVRQERCASQQPAGFCYIFIDQPFNCSLNWILYPTKNVLQSGGPAV